MTEHANREVVSTGFEKIEHPVLSIFRRIRKTSLRSLITLCALFAATLTNSQAASFVWDGGDGAKNGDGVKWNDAKNWTGGVAPTSAATTEVILGVEAGGGGAPYTLQVTPGTFNLNSLVFSNVAPAFILDQDNKNAAVLTFTGANATIIQNSANVQTIGKAASGNLDVTFATNVLIRGSGTGALYLNSTITGKGSLTFSNAAGSLVIDSYNNADNTFTNLIINAGEVDLWMTDGFDAFQGTATINSNGLLKLWGANMIDNNSLVNISTGGVFNMAGLAGNGTNEVVGGINNYGLVSIAGGTLGATRVISNLVGGTISDFGSITGAVVNLGIILTTNGTLTLSRGPIQSGTINVANNGTISFSQAWSNNGTINLFGGRLVGSAMTNQGLVTGFGTIAALIVNSNQVNLGMNISNSYQQIAGTTTVSSVGTVTGTATISGGLFDLNGGTYTNAVMALNGTGVLTNSIANAVFNGGLSNAATVAFTVDTRINGLVTNLGTFNYRGTINNNFVTTAGTVTLNNTATITGAATLSGGIFDLNSNTGIVGSLNGTAGQILNNGNGLGVMVVTNGGTYSGRIIDNTTGNGAVSLIVTGGLLTLSGSLSNTFSGTTYVKAGELDLGKSAGTNAIAGLLIIGDGVGGANADIVKLTSASQIVDTVTVSIGSSGKFDLNSKNETVGALADNGAGGGNITLGSGVLTFGSASNSTFSGIISGTGSIYKDGNGTQTLAGVSTYSGITTIGNGVLAISASNNLGNTSQIVFESGQNNTLQLTANMTLTQPISVQNGPGNFLVDAGKTGTLAGVISGFSQVRKDGEGTIIMVVSNNYSGRTQVNAGTLQLGTGGAIISAANFDVFGGTFDMNGKTQSVVSTLVLGGVTTFGTISSGGGQITVGSLIDARAGWLASIVGGTGSLVKSTTNTVTLTSVNSFTGGTFVNNGELDLTSASNSIPGALYIGLGSGTANSAIAKLLSSNQIVDSAVVYIDATGQLNLNGFNETVATLSDTNAGGGNINLGSGVLTFGNSTNTTFSGAIAGSGGITKLGTSVFTMSGTAASTYSGTTTVSNGEIDLGKTAGVNAIGGNVAINGGSVKLLANEQIADTAVVNVNSGSFNLNGSKETVATTIIGSGGLLTNGVSGGTLSGGVTNGGTVYLSQDTYFNGVVTNTGAMYFRGTISNILVNTGSFSLNNNSTISGAVINRGSVSVAANSLSVFSTWNNDGTITIDDGFVQGAVMTNRGTISGKGAIVPMLVNDVGGFVGVRPGTLIFSNSLVQNGTLLVTNAGTLNVQAAWNNNGTINQLGGTIIGATLTNNSLISGFGTITARLANGSLGTLMVTGGTAVVSVAPLQTGNIIVTNTGTLNVVADWENAGTLSERGGTILGGILTNTSQISGFGTISSRLVNTSFGTLLASGGTNLLTQAPVQNGTILVTNAGTLNVQTDWNNDGTLSQVGGTVIGAILTNKNLISGFGTIQARVVNTALGTLTAAGGTNFLQFSPIQNGTVIATNAGTLNVAADWDNSGTVSLRGGTIMGSVLTNKSLISGFGTLTARLVNSSLGTLLATGGTNFLAFAPEQTGTIIVTNSGTLNVAVDWDNSGTISERGGTIIGAILTNKSFIGGFGTISAQLVNTTLGTLTPTGGTNFLALAPVQNGTMILTNAGTLNVAADWDNSGTISEVGGTIIGANLTNKSLISGFGTITARLVNSSLGTLLATGGTNHLTLAPVQVGTVIVTNAGTLNVAADWDNSGTILEKGGTIIGAVLTNRSLISGFGTITARLANSSLGTLLATGGTNYLTLAPVQNGTIIVTNSGTLNVAVDWNNNGTINERGGTIIGAILTNKSFISGFGTLTAQLVNTSVGTLVATDGTNFLALAPEQNGTMVVSNNGTLNVAVSWENAGTLNERGGTIIGGSLTNQGLIHGFGTITPQLVNNNNGTLTASGGTSYLVLAPEQNGTFIVTNSGTLNVAANWNNNGTVSERGGTIIGGILTNNSLISGFGTITPRLINSSFGTLVASGGTNVLALAPEQSGTFIAANGGTLNVQQAWSNSGLLKMQGGTVMGSMITNDDLISGFGTITPQVMNNNGTLIANQGTLTLLAGPVQGGVVIVSNGATLAVQPAWSNVGTVELHGGGLGGGSLSNLSSGSLSGFGVVSSPTVVNSGTILATSFTTALNFTGTGFYNSSGGELGAVTGRVSVSGVFTNAGTVTFLHSYGTFQSAVVNQGAWITDPSTITYNSDFTVATNGYMTTTDGDVNAFRANFYNFSRRSNDFDTSYGTFTFNGNTGQTQVFAVAGLNLGGWHSSVQSSNEVWVTANGATVSTNRFGFGSTAEMLGYSNNFALGNLTIGTSVTTSSLELVDAFGLFMPTDGKVAGLYVDTLTINDGSLLIISNNVELFYRNINGLKGIGIGHLTGDENVLLLNGSSFHNIGFGAVGVIPEPNALMLLVTGGSAIWMWVRRRRRQNSASV